MSSLQSRLGWLRAWGMLAALSLALSSGACSSSATKEITKPVFPVRGQVFVQNKPAVAAFVLFVPVNEPAEPKDPRPRAEVGADGSFQLSTYGENDGAPAGEYIVTITWPGNEDANEPADKLLGRYSDAATSRLRATVKEAPNEIPAFRL